MSNMVVNTNVLALNSHRSLKGVGTIQSKASARLSSGLKINSAADDAAGLAISEKMRAQIRGLDMASKNAQDGISLIQTAEGGMQEIDNMLQRIRELVNQASNDTNEHNDVNTGDRQKMQDEIDALVKEIDSMGERVEFNKKKVINGDFSGEAETSKTVTDNAYKTLLEAVTRTSEMLVSKESSASAAQQAANAASSAYDNFTKGTDWSRYSNVDSTGVDYSNLTAANNAVTNTAYQTGLVNSLGLVTASGVISFEDTTNTGSTMLDATIETTTLDSAGNVVDTQASALVEGTVLTSQVVTNSYDATAFSFSFSDTAGNASNVQTTLTGTQNSDDYTASFAGANSSAGYEYSASGASGADTGYIVTLEFTNASTDAITHTTFASVSADGLAALQSLSSDNSISAYATNGGASVSSDVTAYTLTVEGAAGSSSENLYLTSGDSDGYTATAYASVGSNGYDVSTVDSAASTSVGSQYTSTLATDSAVTTEGSANMSGIVVSDSAAMLAGGQNYLNGLSSATNASIGVSDLLYETAKSIGTDGTKGAAAQDYITKYEAAKDAADAYELAQELSQGLNDIEQSLSDSYANSVTAKKEADNALIKAENAFKLAKANADAYLTANPKAEQTKTAENKGLYFQVGANANQGITVTIGSAKSDKLGIGDGDGTSYINVLENSGIDITEQLDILDTALSYVTSERSKLGATQNRLEYTIKSLDVSSENLSAAESRIRDTDMAKEMMDFTKANVLQQAATSMLAQANQAPQNILQLLR